jgi:hypothetical protein
MMQRARGSESSRASSSPATELRARACASAAASWRSDIRGASTAANAVVIGIDAIHPIDPTSAAIADAEDQ